MKISGKQIDRVELLLRDPEACWIAAGIEFGMHVSTDSPKKGKR